MTQRFSHFSFTVSNLDRAVEWYADYLGLDLVHRQRQDNDYTREFVGVPSAVLDVAILAPRGGPGEPALELVEYLAPEMPAESRPKIERSPATVGFSHLSVVVSDIHALYSKLVAAGARFRSPPVLITAGVNKGGFVCYLSDPDGNGLELFQPVQENRP